MIESILRRRSSRGGWGYWVRGYCYLQTLAAKCANKGRNECPKQAEGFRAKGLGPDDLLGGRRGCSGQESGWKVREAGGVHGGVIRLRSDTLSCGYPPGKLQGGDQDRKSLLSTRDKCTRRFLSTSESWSLWLPPGPCSEPSTRLLPLEKTLVLSNLQLCEMAKGPLGAVVGERRALAGGDLGS